MATITSQDDIDVADGMLPDFTPDKLPSTSGRSAPIAMVDFEEDIYEDAVDGSVLSTQAIALEQSFIDCDIAMQKFFNNDMRGAMAIMKPLCNSSLYHSLGVAIFEFIPAILTFDPVQIKTAMTAIDACVDICIQKKKQFTFVESIGSLVKKPKSVVYTDMEAHAELCYAEALLLQAALTVLGNEDAASVIMGTLKVKHCYNSYQTCWKLMEAKKWDSFKSRIHFKSGVRLGIATFNLMISLMPARLIAFLKFVGFSANKYYGLSELDKGANSAGMRAVLCDLTLLGYHLIICQFIGGRGDMDYAEIRLKGLLKTYPDSVWFLAFRARKQFLQSQLDFAVCTYARAIQQQEDDLRQFRLLCYWDLMWIHGLKLEFKIAADLAGKLISENVWSKTTHCYIQAAMLMEMDINQLSRGEEALISELIRTAPQHKVRIAGRSLPMEKFVIRRCARYQAQGQRLLHPGLELMCIWNLFHTLTEDKLVVRALVAVIEKTIKDVEDSPSRDWMGAYAADNMAMLHFIHGCALSASDLPIGAIRQLKRVIELKPQIKEDTFLIPYAVCELALCYYQMGDMESAYFYLTEAKKKYSNYNLENRLLFRVQARFDMVRKVTGLVKFPPYRGVKI